MNWYKESLNEIILYHATIPKFADQITESENIVSSLDLESETGQNYAGWNFQQGEKIQYGEGVYLSSSSNLALYYAMLRLEKEWNNISPELAFFDEDNGYLALFTVHILDPSLLVEVNGPEEYVYKGRITANKNNIAWFEGPEWIDKTEAQKKYYDKRYTENLE